VPVEGAGQRIGVRGTEIRSVELEEYANFLRDIVFLHDRIWILSQNHKSAETLYYSNFFYTRGHRPVPTEQRLRLVSAVIGSPFDLNINVNFGKSFKQAAKAFVEILRGIATLPEYMKQEKLRTRALRVAVHSLEREERATLHNIIPSNSAIRELPAISDEKLAPIVKDMLRLAESPLRIQTVVAGPPEEGGIQNE
jgi:hypothetical protein